MDTICRAYEAQIDDVSVQERMIVAKINTGALDRYKTVIDPKGGRLDNYRKCPVVLWEHGKDPIRGRVPMGKNVGLQAIKARNGCIIARTQFGKDDFSMGMFDLYRDEVLKGWSIFAMPDAENASPPTREELRSRPELETCEMVYRTWELGEYSGVAVPGNAETLSILEARGIWFPAEARATPSCPPPQRDGDEDDPENEAQHTGPDADDEPQGRRIRKRGDRWDVLSEDGNKLLGSHATEAEAEKQLQAIEAGKHPDRPAPELSTVPGRSYESIHTELLGEFRLMKTELIQHIGDFADLLRGRV